jgi:hypothetical protein
MGNTEYYIAMYVSLVCVEFLMEELPHGEVHTLHTYEYICVHAHM